MQSAESEIGSGPARFQPKCRETACQTLATFFLSPKYRGEEGNFFVSAARTLKLGRLLQSTTTTRKHQQPPFSHTQPSVSADPRLACQTLAIGGKRNREWAGPLSTEMSRNCVPDPCNFFSKSKIQGRRRELFCFCSQDAETWQAIAVYYHD